MKNFFTITLSIFIAIFFCGCPAELNITPNNDSTFSIEYNSIFGEKLTSALKDLSQISAQFSEANPSEFDLSQIIDAQTIENELNLRYLSQTKIKIQKKSQNSYNFIANAKTKNSAKNQPQLLSQEKLKSGKTRFTLTLGPEILQATLLQNETTLKTFADILMAPLVTGEEMTTSEYKDLLTEIYGESVASELLSGDFKINVVLPNGKTLSQKIPIAELLVTSGERVFVFEY